jgi:hypothetical protein
MLTLAMGRAWLGEQRALLQALTWVQSRATVFEISFQEQELSLLSRVLPTVGCFHPIRVQFSCWGTACMRCRRCMLGLFHEHGKVY